MDDFLVFFDHSHHLLLCAGRRAVQNLQRHGHAHSSHVARRPQARRRHELPLPDLQPAAAVQAAAERGRGCSGLDHGHVQLGP